uniref:BPTI/Kunitz inhibitor domain-containing protein n=1 Tax=Equus caballus TaxID=9796 RepID=A0A9L0SIU2_HORSE
VKFSRFLALCLAPCLVGTASSGKTSRELRANLKQETPQEMTPTLPALCQLPSVRGPCKGYFHQYFYSSTSNECEHFIYGGCQAMPTILRPQRSACGSANPLVSSLTETGKAVVVIG